MSKNGKIPSRIREKIVYLRKFYFLKEARARLRFLLLNSREVWKRKD